MPIKKISQFSWLQKYYGEWEQLKKTCTPQHTESPKEGGGMGDILNDN